MLRPKYIKINITLLYPYIQDTYNKKINSYMNKNNDITD